MQAKILIVGGGVMGTALAVRAAQRTDPVKEPVILCERADLAAGSSGGSGAILRQFYADRELSLMARDSMREYARFASATGRDIGFRRSGVLTLTGPGQAEWHERIESVVADLKSCGLEIHSIGAEEIREAIPGIEVQDGARAVWEPESGFVDPKLVVEAFASVARTHGAVTRLGTEVEELLIESGKVVGARTNQGEIQAEQVVLMGGPWTNRLLERSGITLPLRVVVPENVYLAMPESPVEAEEADAETSPRVNPGLAGLPGVPGDPGLMGADSIPTMSGAVEPEPDSPRGMHPVLIDLDAEFYCRVEPTNGRVRVGRIDYEGEQELADPDDRSDEVSNGLKEWAREKLTARLPEYTDRDERGTITSWYTLTPDAQPVIGPLPEVEGLIVAAGFSGHGFKLAPSVAEGVTQMLFGEPVTAFDATFFSPTRFAGSAQDWSGRFGL